MTDPRPYDLWADSRLHTLHLAAYPAGDATSRSAGDPPTLVVLHGLGSGIDVLRDAVPRFDPFAALAGLGANVLALDWPGHGRSGGARGHLTYRLAMEATATAVDLATRTWRGPVVLIGLALGGTLACYAALEDERVAGVVSHGLIDLRDIRPVLRRLRQQAALPAAALLRRGVSDRLSRRVRLPLSAVMAPADSALDPRLATRLRRHPLAVRSYDLQGLGSILLTPEDKPALAALRIPTLVVVGGQDLVLPPTAAHAAASQTPAVEEVWVLPAAGHQLLLEHPRALLERVGAFLRTVGDRQR